MVKDGIATANQDHADEQIKISSKLWRADEILDYCKPAISETVRLDSLTATMEEISDYRRMMKSFKASTAVAYDNIKPYQMAYSICQIEP